MYLFKSGFTNAFSCSLRLNAETRHKEIISQTDYEKEEGNILSHVWDEMKELWEDDVKNEYIFIDNY